MNTPWQYLDSSHRVAFYTDDAGAMHSALVTAPDVQAWIAAGNIPADPPAPSPEALTAAAFAAGIAITCASSPALNGTYAIDEAAQQKITSEQVYIATTGKFTNGQTSRGWKDAAGNLHTFPDVAHFTAFAESVAQLVDAIYAAEEIITLAGGSWVAPTMTATIA